MKYNEEQLRYMINNALENEEKLSHWEQEFLESIDEQLSERHSLSEKQEIILERIHERMP